jgi:hypothetical protein
VRRISELVKAREEKLAYYRDLFSKNKGLARMFANDLNVADCTVSLFLRGNFDSRRISAAMEEFLRSRGIPLAPASYRSRIPDVPSGISARPPSRSAPARLPARKVSVIADSLDV